MHILLAMSGGVDSSVAAYLLRKAGHEVTGVTFRLWDYPDDDCKEACCSAEDVDNARLVCEGLGIPHYSIARGQKFMNMVVEPFINSYINGSTPAPCMDCNTNVKFPELFKLACVVGADYIATGHYSRIENGNLLEGVDKKKDQSYYLYHLLNKLGNIIMPLGGYFKEQVKEIAKTENLPGWDKGESMGLCFAPDHDAFIRERAGDRIRPGNIIGPDGRIVAQHDGAHRYTPGQSRGLGVSIGSKTYVNKIIGSDVHLGPAPKYNRVKLSGYIGGDIDNASVVFRYRGVKVPCRKVRDELIVDNALAVVGQYAVLYDGERVVGGGRIEVVG